MIRIHVDDDEVQLKWHKSQMMRMAEASSIKRADGPAVRRMMENEQEPS